MPGLLAPHRYIFTHSFTTRIPDPCGYLPVAESCVHFKIPLTFLEKDRLKHLNCFFHIFPDADPDPQQRI
jgi:hypothetical protein